jgi:hypothetical protein
LRSGGVSGGRHLRKTREKRGESAEKKKKEQMMSETTLRTSSSQKPHCTLSRPGRGVVGCGTPAAERGNIYTENGFCFTYATYPRRDIRPRCT